VVVVVVVVVDDDEFVWELFAFCWCSSNNWLRTWTVGKVDLSWTWDWINDLRFCVLSIEEFVVSWRIK
jgi:hypothetical protein